MSPLAQFLPAPRLRLAGRRLSAEASAQAGQTQNLILEIFHIFLRLNFLSSLNLNPPKAETFFKGLTYLPGRCFFIVIYGKPPSMREKDGIRIHIQSLGLFR